MIKLVSTREGRQRWILALILVGLFSGLATIGGVEIYLCKVSGPLTRAKAASCFRHLVR
jgi:hypothetical protein